MNTYTVSKPLFARQTVGETRMVNVSLPAPPFPMPEADRAETAPRSLPIRAGLGIPRVDKMLRHAERIAT